MKLIIPELHETLLLQQAQLIAGLRDAQLFTFKELDLPEGFERFENEDGVFHYNPSKLKPSDITADRYNIILNLGPYSKEDLNRDEHPVTLVERDPRGIEVRTACGTTSTAKEQFDYMLATKTPGHVIVLEHPSTVILQRLAGANNDWL